MYAFVAETDAERALLKRKGAVWSPPLERWIAWDLSTWTLSRFKRKGLTPQIAPAPVPAAEPKLHWHKWIRVVAFSLPLALFVYIFVAKFFDLGSFALAFGISMLWFVFSTFFSKLFYAFYRRLQGDDRYWERLKADSHNLRPYRDDYEYPTSSSFNDPENCPITGINYVGIPGNIYTRRD